jgi:hypothetical protein
VGIGSTDSNVGVAGDFDASFRAERVATVDTTSGGRVGGCALATIAIGRIGDLVGEGVDPTGADVQLTLKASTKGTRT